MVNSWKAGENVEFLEAESNNRNLTDAENSICNILLIREDCKIDKQENSLGSKKNAKSWMFSKDEAVKVLWQSPVECDSEVKLQNYKDLAVVEDST